ncbi:hypothetical protein G647_02607 [Cladophialophora carrionii CBS 160.54]|uniref:DUF1776-domain-containing protein n=1 Tax=Cladophialophora carrionii CBS 160.54 TaxID=1279043 RepID=V9DG35_9EURO|nr:uncharacterized protein G647_02607 [Cladophialophora carrionii CBS 160.54]ETI25830.1 hypothetical protein G647_02607 [Cladophialophora carrionii CBS 160.54]
MTSDDQQFLDLLASVPQDIAHYGSRVADYVDKHANAIANDIRDAIDRASWIPDSLRPPRASGTSGAFFVRPPPPPQGILQKTGAWVSRNRTAIAVVLAFAGTTIYLVHRRRRAHTRKRRAKKLPNGAKKEIVVLACSTFHDALTRSLAVDLERRGYVVYVTVSSTEEDSLVQQEAKQDLRPLWIDLTSTVPNPAVDVHPNLEPIRDHITRGAGNMTLAGLIVFPGCSGYSEGPLALLPPSDIVDTINTRVVAPVLTVQQFLPLLANHSPDPKAPSSIVVAYPSIPNSLSPPRQVPECLVTSSLSALAHSLRREISAASANITVSELKLGNFDMGSVSTSPWARTTPTQSTLGASGSSSSALTHSTHSQSQSQSGTQSHWHSSQRAAYQRKSLGQRSSIIRGSSAREFHNAVFDALAPPQTFRPFGSASLEFTSSRRADVVFVGSGARIYDLVGKVFPGGLVGLMMGWNRRRTAPPEEFYQSVYHDDARRVGGSTSASASGSAVGTAAAAASGSATGGQSGSASAWGFHSLGSDSGIWEKV